MKIRIAQQKFIEYSNDKKINAVFTHAEVIRIDFPKVYFLVSNAHLRY